MTPRATLRLQFRREYTLDDATARLDQFAALGISHLYASPLQQARQGSAYGYDIVDYGTINPEVGGEAALRRMAAGLRERGMGLILDIVPNHMATSWENKWWRNVLENGRGSPYAEYFDIDWECADPALQGKVLAPFLGQSYGEALASGDLKLQLDAESGELQIAYFAQRFPVALRDYAMVLASGGDTQSKRLSASFADLGGVDDGSNGDAIRSVVRKEIAEGGGDGIERAIAQFAAGTPESEARLHRLLDRQHYRLAWWRTAAEEINWRRFFEVSDLIGMRADRNDVFSAQHELVFRLYAEGIIDGVRVDHIDGLANPRVYCEQLREHLEALAPQREAAGLPPAPPYIIVEKILSDDELLAVDWHVDGNTGYDFMDEVSSVLHDPAGAEPLNALWRELSQGQASFREGLHAARHQLLAEHFVAEFEALVNLVHRIARSRLGSRDVSRGSLRRALHALLVSFPAYRLYGEKTGRREVNAGRLQSAMQGAREMLRVSDHATLSLLDQWLGAEPPASAATEFEQDLRCRAMIKFQQLTPPLAAKSLEDTVFYRYGRLLSRNEVGSNPERLSRTVEEFHQCNLQRQAMFPRSLLATASHDHKRGEDTRARLAVLSEVPQLWQAAASRWRAINAELRGHEYGAGAEVPDASDEYMLYQMLVAAWPPTLQPDDIDGLRALAVRLGEWQQKAMREAKARSDWMLPNTAYEEASRAFIDRTLGLAEGVEPGTFVSAFVKDVAAFVSRIECAGVINGLSQTVLRLTCPGIPDLYQGTDRWDFSLVDPDNRRAVTYDEEILFEGGCVSGECALGLLETWRDGRIKQQLIASTLNLRKRLPDVFSGEYVPLEIEGPRAAQLIAFARYSGSNWIVVIATRLAANLINECKLPKLDAATWDDTRIRLPDALRTAMPKDFLRSTLFHQSVGVVDGTLRVADALAVWPIAVLTNNEHGGA